MSINEEIVHLRDEIISSKIKLGASSLFNDPDIVSDRNILLQTVEKDNVIPYYKKIQFYVIFY